MPSEPDNQKMEELLKAYAKKRQDASGAPLEMHPATRRLLQGEVARTYAKAQPAERVAWYKMLFQFWPRVAFALGIVLLLGGTLWIMNRPAGHSGNVSMAKNESDTRRPEPGLRPMIAEQEKPVAPTKPGQSFGRDLGFAEDAGAPQTPVPAPPTSAATAPAPTAAPSAKTVDKFGVQLRDEMARNELSDDRKRSYTDSLSAQNTSRFSTATPPAPLPTSRKLMEEKLAEAPASPAQPARRGYLAGTGKQDSDSDAVLDGAPGEKAGKDLQASLGRKETLAKKEASIKPSAASAPAAPATPAPVSDQPVPGTAAGLGVAKQDLALYYSTATAWTNTAYTSVPNWAFQTAESQSGSALLTGRAGTQGLQNQPSDPSAADRDSKVVGGFGNVGGDGRYARSKTQDLNTTSLAAANGPVPAGATQPSGGYAAVRGDAAGAQQNGRLPALALMTNSTAAAYSQFGGGGGLGGASASSQVIAGKVLEHFQTIQNGDTLRIVDSDGSIYEGKLLVTSEANKRLGEQERPTPTDKAKISNPETEARVYRQVAATPDEFKVSGVNRTLGQLVVVTGRLDRSSSLVRSEREELRRGVQTEPLQQAQKSKPAVSLQFTRPESGTTASATNVTFRISGAATVGGTNLILLEAVPLNR